MRTVTSRPASLAVGGRLAQLVWKPSASALDRPDIGNERGKTGVGGGFTVDADLLDESPRGVKLSRSGGPRRDTGRDEVPVAGRRCRVREQTLGQCEGHRIAAVSGIADSRSLPFVESRPNAKEPLVGRVATRDPKEAKYFAGGGHVGRQWHGKECVPSDRKSNGGRIGGEGFEMVECVVVQGAGEDRHEIAFSKGQSPCETGMMKGYDF